MNCCGKRCISIVILIIAVIILIQTSFLTLMVLNLRNVSIQASTEELEEEWKLVIPKINVSAAIKDGTSGNIINNYIGHFIETPKENGNIGLVAASAGYKENYFKDLEDLVQGDEIVYIKGNTKKEYKVTTNVVIKQTDWSYLSSTNDNRITLITGILEKPEFRRCVQAIEI